MGSWLHSLFPFENYDWLANEKRTIVFDTLKQITLFVLTLKMTLIRLKKNNDFNLKFLNALFE